MVKILVADDEADLEILIKQKFRKHIREQKYEFFFALNGREAFEKLNEHADISVVLSDIKMPKIDGTELLQKLMDSNSNSSVIMMSGHGTIETAVDAVKKGAYDYLAKPIDLNRLDVESNVAAEVIAELKARGHDVRSVRPLSISGCATAVMIDLRTGTRIAGADPRRDCYAMAY